MIAITMDSNSKIIATALHFAWANGDIEKFMHFFDDEVLYQRHSSGRELTETLPSPFSCRGKDAMLHQMKLFQQKYELLDLEVVYMVAEGGKVASRCILQKRNLQTGRATKNELCHFWTVRGDKVTRLLEFGSGTHQEEEDQIIPLVPATNVILFSDASAKR
ncbi:MAG: nuclear transport factor 2 family protein [Stappiaceae bacterium]